MISLDSKLTCFTGKCYFMPTSRTLKRMKIVVIKTVEKHIQQGSTIEQNGKLIPFGRKLSDVKDNK